MESDKIFPISFFILEHSFEFLISTIILELCNGRQSKGKTHIWNAVIFTSLKMGFRNRNLFFKQSLIKATLGFFIGLLNDVKKGLEEKSFVYLKPLKLNEFLTCLLRLFC